jgi:class 3 adenylate cyclase/tetratricopeptide (TPR) repeat protein
VTKSRGAADRQAYLAALCRTVPYHVTEAVLANPSKSSVADQFWQGTVLYADLVGFTSMCEAWAGEGESGLSRLSDVLSTFFTLLLEHAIFPHAGYVVQFGGDSLTVVYRDKGHAHRAAASALEARQLVADVDRARTDGSHGLKLRVGLASGEIRMPVLGDDTQRGVVVAGEQANRAVQLQDAAEPGTVVIDASTARELGDDAIGTPHSKGAFTLHDLARLPTREPIRELEGRIEDDTEAKIDLLEPFVPPPLAARLKSMPDGWRIDGELRRCIVAFSEVRGLVLTEHREEVQHISRSFIRRIRRYGGIVTKADVAAEGHRIMAVFGLHAPTENDAERALLAQTELSGAFKSLAETLDLPLSMRTGVHLGPVYFGAIGSPYRHDVTVVGDTVNVAARLAALAGPFQVVSTLDVLEESNADFEQTQLEPVRVKGKAEPLKVAIVHAVAGGRAHYVQRRRKQRYVAGREREERRLLDIVGNALDGQGRIIGLSGEAGVGKSYMLSSIIDRWIGGGGLGLLGRCRYATQSTPLEPARQMFASYLGLASDERGEQRKLRVREAFAQSDYGQDPDAPWLQAFLEVADADDVRTPDGLPMTDSGWERVIASIQRFVDWRVGVEPLMYVLEDAHHADALTLELSRRIGSNIDRGQRFLFVVTYRPDPALDELRKALDHEAKLGALGLRQTSELVRHMLGATRIDEAVAAFLWQRSLGNPGHLTELVRFLRDRSLLQVRAGAVAVPPPGVALLEDAVPESLEKLALARLEQLGGLERRVLRSASAIGKSFGKGVLEEVVAGDLEAEEVETGVVALLDEGVIAPDSGVRPTYRFREDITRAVTYSTIPEHERREAHRRIADALERLSGADKTSSAVTLAMHREKAAQLGEAAEHYARAVRVASLAGLDAETRHLVNSWERVVDRLPPDRRPSHVERAKMAVRKLVAIARRGAPAETLEQGRRIIADHWEVLEEPGRSVVELWLGDALIALAQPDAALTRLRRVFDSGAEGRVRGEAARLIATAEAHAERYDEAEAWLEKARSLAGAADGYRAQRVALDGASLLSFRGRHDEARVIFARVRDEARRRDHMRVAALAARGAAECDLLSGEFDAAAEGFSSALVMARALGNRTEEAIGELRLGQCRSWGQAPERGRPHLERALQLSRDVGHKLTEIEAIVDLGAVIALTDDIEEGADLLEQGYRRAVRANLRHAEISADLHLLHNALLNGHTDALRAQLERCEAHADHLLAPLFHDAWEMLKTRAMSALADTERMDVPPSRSQS